MMDQSAVPEVLATLNADGSRRWVRPKLSRGRFLSARRALAWFLMAAFAGIPFLHVGGKPLFLIDLPRRELTLLGATFLPTDSVLLMLLLLCIFVGIFLLTALFGRVWCGYGCPQTVYLEFLFRPLERLIEGGPSKQMALDRRGGLPPRRALKYAVFAALSAVLGNAFLAYFVGVDQLAVWMQSSPAQHPAGFLVMATTSALVFVDFAYFREQMCSVACPYARLQSALLDERSLIIGYDAQRGEPRGKRKAGKSAGDCIDCRACVVTCPAGIDIRKGLQLECVACAQCIDACDAIMTRIGKPTGLVRYSSQAALVGKPASMLRPRVILYPLVLLALLGLLSLAASHRQATEVTVLRGAGAPYTVRDGGVSNPIRIKLHNRADVAKSYALQVSGASNATLNVLPNPLPVQPGGHATAEGTVSAPLATLAQGKTPLRITVTAGGEVEVAEFRVLGPQGGAR